MKDIERGYMKTHFCPTQSGLLTGFRPMWKESSEESWKNIPIKINTKSKRPLPPYPCAGSGILSTINLFGYSQAQAIAWEFSAMAEEMGKSIDVRVARYEITYEIKAKNMEKNTVMEDTLKSFT